MKLMEWWAKKSPRLQEIQILSLILSLILCQVHRIQVPHPSAKLWFDWRHLSSTQALEPADQDSFMCKPLQDRYCLNSMDWAMNWVPAVDGRICTLAGPTSTGRALQCREVFTHFNTSFFTALRLYYALLIFTYFYFNLSKTYFTRWGFTRCCLYLASEMRHNALAWKPCCVPSTPRSRESRVHRKC